MIHLRTFIACVATGLIAPTLPAQATDNEFSHRAKWQTPGYAQTRRRMLAIIDTAEASDASKDAARQLWPATEPTGRPSQFQRAIDSAALINPAAETLVEFCTAPRQVLQLPNFSVFESETVSPLIRNNLQLLYGRWLARERLYDEAHEQLAGLSASDVLDPASLLFYQGVVFHRLLKKNEALAALEQLLSAGDDVPLRYRNVAALMKADIEPLEDESLDHIARRMHDVRRRLELGRAGKKVLEVEDGVVESLDKLIKKLEEEQKQQQSAGGGGGGSPAKDSQILGGTGPGNVTKKNIGDKSSWGDLPPKKRREAMQQIGKNYPPHYREIIEQYFKRLAADDDNGR